MVISRGDNGQAPARSFWNRREPPLCIHHCIVRVDCRGLVLSGARLTLAYQQPSGDERTARTEPSI